MERSILVAYATRHGSTREVADWIADSLGARGLAVDVARAEDVTDLEPYDGVVLGGALYMGRLHRDARAFLGRHRAALTTLPLAVFALGPGSLEPADVAKSRSQLDGALAATAELEPFASAIFGGVVAPEKLRFPFSRMQPVDARDWTAIEAWAAGVADTLVYGKPAVEAGDRRKELQETPR
jgi:menaquinone-dependent protoporphyrinogen oxidase